MAKRLAYNGMLRCDICGEPCVPAWGDDPTPVMREQMVIRCVACAATEEAEAITAVASSPTEGPQDAST